MYVIREVFQTKPGKAKNLVEIFKNTKPHFLEMGAANMRILTDFVATYWTVVIEFEVSEINDYVSMYDNKPKSEQVGAIMNGYMDLVLGGHREMFKIE
jgi:hypothetical protein